MKLSTNNVWHPNVDTYIVELCGIEIGYMYLDLIKRKNKNIITPIAILLRDKYKDENNNINLPIVTILSNYTDFQTKSLTYCDIILLFKEFGNTIQLLCSTFCSNETHKLSEFSFLMSYVMEYIAWEKNTIKQFVKNYDKDDINQTIKDITQIRTTNFAILLKERCLNAFFDHILYNSIDLIKVLENYDSLSTKQHPIKILYKKCFISMMDSNINVDSLSINPNILNQEINSGGMIYKNVLLEILSYSVYKQISKEPSNTFIQDVIMSNNLKESFLHFINKLNPYDTFVDDFL
jgi:hypothetical protein